LTYNADVVIGTDAWLRRFATPKCLGLFYNFSEETGVLVGVGVFICVKNYVSCAELWLDEGFEMIAVEVKGMNPKYTWEFIGIYRAPYEDMRVIERLAAPTGYSRNSTKRSIIGGDLNLSQADWNGSAEGTSGNQALINRLVWEKGYTQVVGSSTRGDALLDVSLCGPKTQCLLQHYAGDQRPLWCVLGS
jgi:hypothetical protein